MKVTLTLIAMIGCTVLANLLLKTGASASAQGNGEVGGLIALLNWRTVAGLASFGVAGLLYAVVLRWLPLNIAVSFAAAQFVAVVLASTFVLDESIAGAQWIGVVLISLGIVFIGWSQH